MRSKRIAIGMLALAWAAAAQAQPPAGRLLASQCAQCHGTDGRSVADIEYLAGQDGLLGDLREMRTSSKNDIMHKQAKGYSEAQLRLIAQYFASLPEHPGED